SRVGRSRGARSGKDPSVASPADVRPEVVSQSDLLPRPRGRAGQQGHVAPAVTADPALVWGVAARAIALVYLIAFWSLDREILALCGSRGITPIAGRLARVRRDMGATGLAQFPSLLWISSSDTALTWLPRAGLLAAALVVGGVASRAMLAVAW